MPAILAGIFLTIRRPPLFQRVTSQASDGLRCFSGHHPNVRKVSAKLAGGIGKAKRACKTSKCPKNGRFGHGNAGDGCSDWFGAARRFWLILAPFGRRREKAGGGPPHSSPLELCPLNAVEVRMVSAPILGWTTGGGGSNVGVVKFQDRMNNRTSIIC